MVKSMPLFMVKKEVFEWIINKQKLTYEPLFHVKK